MDTAEHWRRNLWVCAAGSFTTLVGMTLLIPFLPLYVAQLGARGELAVSWWSGVAYAATFFTAALVAPLWGRIGDRYGRKLNMMRASAGMAVAVALTGLAQDVTQLVLLRALTGLLGGYASGATILVAVQTPRENNAWALGVLASGVMAGSLAGPLVGGLLPPLVGIRATFLLSGALIVPAFLATAFLLHEERGGRRPPPKGGAEVVDRGTVGRMLLTGMLLAFANFSIEPVLATYVGTLVHGAHVTAVAGFVMAAAALGSIVAAPRVGRLADRLGPRRIIAVGLVAGAALMLAQGLAASGWQLVALRFAMGLALGGLPACIASLIRASVPDRSVGAVLGLSTSAQYVGQVAGPLTGGLVGGLFGPPSVFVATAAAMLAGAAVVAVRRSARSGKVEPAFRPGRAQTKDRGPGR